MGSGSAGWVGRVRADGDLSGLDDGDHGHGRDDAGWNDGGGLDERVDLDFDLDLDFDFDFDDNHRDRVDFDGVDVDVRLNFHQLDERDGDSAGDDRGAAGRPTRRARV